MSSLTFFLYYGRLILSRHGLPCESYLLNMTHIKWLSIPKFCYIHKEFYIFFADAGGNALVNPLAGTVMADRPTHPCDPSSMILRGDYYNLRLQSEKSTRVLGRYMDQL